MHYGCKVDGMIFNLATAGGDAALNAPINIEIYDNVKEIDESFKWERKGKRSRDLKEIIATIKKLNEKKLPYSLTN